MPLKKYYMLCISMSVKQKDLSVHTQPVLGRRLKKGIGLCVHVSNSRECMSINFANEVFQSKLKAD